MKGAAKSKVAVDAYYVTGKLRGMARYARMLMQSIPEDHLEVLPRRPAHGLLRTITSDQKWFPIWEQAILPFKAAAAKAKYLLCPYNTGPLWNASVPVIVVIHDLIFLNRDLDASPSLIQNLGRAYRAFVAKRVAKSSALVITCSEFSKAQIIAQLGVPERKINVIPNVVDNAWFALQPSPNLTAPYLFAVTGEAPSKNTGRLIAAMAILAETKPTLQLRIAGVRPPFHETFRAIAAVHGLHEKVELLSYMDDEQLRQMYSGASAFVCPSLAEGFGIPLLEALASGVPAASSNATSLPEVAGECAVYFNPLDPRDMATAMAIALDGSVLTRNRAAAGRERAAQFTPVALAPTLKEFWKRLLIAE